MSIAIKKLIYIIYGIVFFWTVFLIMGLQTIENVYCHKEFQLENAGYLIIGGGGGEPPVSIEPTYGD